ncbi:osmotically inducible protein C [Jeotgalibacillus malaysiensis]|uniref:Osmotically inducible protein C n=1 Tax=Jeotgalibacillus malaysiensis TaxID=1508404 RepID=A0A0B5AR40_9BACL|nr:OsmC family protein [Jeotgalibacillus malaysiensis]AJD90559.1 osmotically inducible protein C [Jeotgalibacillus malaysiensis]
MEFKMKEGGFTTDLEYGELHISGNEEYGFRPYQLLVSSVAVCSGGVLRKVLERMRMEFTDIKVNTEIERNEKEANRVEKIHMHFTIKGDLKEEKVKKALEVTRRNCSMVQSVKDSIEITESFEIKA